MSVFYVTVDDTGLMYESEHADPISALKRKFCERYVSESIETVDDDDSEDVEAVNCLMKMTTNKTLKLRK